MVFDRGHGGDQVQVEFPLQPFLHDLHVEQAEEAAAEPEAEGGGRFRLVLEAGVVEPEFLQGVAKRLVLVRVGGIEAREHHGLDVPVAGQQLGRPVGGVQYGIADPAVAHAAQVGHHVPDLAGLQLFHFPLAQLQVAHFVHRVHVLGVGAEGDLHAAAQPAVHHPDAGDGAAVAVEVGIEDEGPERGTQVAARGRDPGHDRLQQGGYPGPVLGRDLEDLLPPRADQVPDLLGPPLRLGAGEVNLVEHRDDLEPGVQRQEKIGQGLGLDSLGGVHHQDGPLAGIERAGDLVGEVHVPRGVDQVEFVLLAIARLVRHADRVELDRDAALPLQVHGVEELLAHEPLFHRAGGFDQPVGEGGFPVVNMGDNAEIPDGGS